MLALEPTERYLHPMHPDALAWLDAEGYDNAGRALDFASRTLRPRSTGEPWPQWPRMRWEYVDLVVGLDMAPDFRPDPVMISSGAYDLVVCVGVLEHDPDWAVTCMTAWRVLKEGGQFVVTAAGPGHEPYSWVDGGPLRPGEHFEVIEPGHLENLLRGVGFAGVDVTWNKAAGGTYASATK